MRELAEFFFLTPAIITISGLFLSVVFAFVIWRHY